MNAELHPRLIVEDADRAIEFYERAFGAELVERFADEEVGWVVHAAISIDGTILALADENPRSQNVAPPTLGGSPVILQLTVADPDAVGARMVELGAEVIFPIADQFYGRREGRLRDPFGHLWILGEQLEERSGDEIPRRMGSRRD